MHRHVREVFTFKQKFISAQPAFHILSKFIAVSGLVVLMSACNKSVDVQSHDINKTNNQKSSAQPGSPLQPTDPPTQPGFSNPAPAAGYFVCSSSLEHSFSLISSTASWDYKNSLIHISELHSPDVRDATLVSISDKSYSVLAAARDNHRSVFSDFTLYLIDIDRATRVGSLTPIDNIKSNSLDEIVPSFVFDPKSKAFAYINKDDQGRINLNVRQLGDLNSNSYSVEVQSGEYAKYLDEDNVATEHTLYNWHTGSSWALPKIAGFSYQTFFRQDSALYALVINAQNWQLVKINVLNQNFEVLFASQDTTNGTVVMTQAEGNWLVAKTFSNSDQLGYINLIGLDSNQKYGVLKQIEFPPEFEQAISQSNPHSKNHKSLKNPEVRALIYLSQTHRIYMSLANVEPWTLLYSRNLALDFEMGDWGKHAVFGCPSPSYLDNPAAPSQSASKNNGDKK